jgi:thiol peroxidase
MPNTTMKSGGQHLLLMDGPRLLARAVIVVDKQGMVRYIQVVPEITNLPDMEKAFDKALEIAQE